MTFASIVGRNTTSNEFKFRQTSITSNVYLREIGTSLYGVIQNQEKGGAIMELAITIAILVIGYLYVSAWRDYVNKK